MHSWTVLLAEKVVRAGLAEQNPLLVGQVESSVTLRAAVRVRIKARFAGNGLWVALRWPKPPDLRSVRGLFAVVPDTKPAATVTVLLAPQPRVVVTPYLHQSHGRHRYPFGSTRHRIQHSPEQGPLAGNDSVQHFPVAAKPAGSDRFQPIRAATRRDLTVCLPLEFGRLPRSKRRRSGSCPPWTCF
jgi:hypothetical protein